MAIPSRSRDGIARSSCSSEYRLTPRGAGPAGAICHRLAKTEDGIRVVDVWESREIFDRSAQELSKPTSRVCGPICEPEIRFYEVHDYFTPGS